MTLPTVVQQKIGNVQGAGSIVVTFDSAVTVGNRIYAFAANFDQSLVTGGTVNDSAGNGNYTKLNSVLQSSDSTSHAVWLMVAAIGGSAFAVTLTRAASQYTTLGIVEVANGSGEDTTGVGTGSSSTPSLNIATSVDVDRLALAMVGCITAGVTHTPGNGFSTVLSYNTNSYITMNIASKSAASAGTDIDPSWTLSSSQNYGAIVVPIIGAAGSPPSAEEGARNLGIINQQATYGFAA